MNVLAVAKNASVCAGKVAIKTGMKLRKASPELMLAGGLIAGVAAVVTACIATTKAEPLIKKTHTELDEIDKKVAKAQENGDDLAEIKKETFHTYRNYIWKLCKIYGLPAFLLLLSIGLILGSHGILKKRYVSTTIAYKALDEAFKDYRGRVKEAVGEEKELHFFNGTHEGGEIVVTDEKGETHTEKIAVKDHDKRYSPYEFDFNAQTAPGNWEANMDYNLYFLRGVENHLNDLLVARGHVFLNDALDVIGLKRTSAGAVTGWLYKQGGDDYVDLGISHYYTDEYCDAQDGFIPNIHLNFNVDGPMWDKIE